MSHIRFSNTTSKTGRLKFLHSFDCSGETRETHISKTKRN